MVSKQTPSQTIGPFFSYCLTPGQYEYPLTDIAGPNLIEDEIDGARIRVTGQVLDGEGNPVDDAMIEIWQADPQGRYAHPADPRGTNSRFRGFGRVGTGTDPDNRFFFDTVKPGSVDDSQAPHLNMIVHMRGMLNHAFTRVYFSDEAAANATDPVLQSVDEARRATLIAEREETEDGVTYRFDIHMQGENETVFFDA